MFKNNLRTIKRYLRDAEIMSDLNLYRSGPSGSTGVYLVGDGGEYKFNISEVLVVLILAAQEMKYTGRQQREWSRQLVYEEQCKAADKMEDAAFDRMLGGIISGGFSIVGGCIGMGYGYRAWNAQPQKGGMDKGAVAQYYNLRGQSLNELAGGVGRLHEAIFNGQAELKDADAERLRALATYLQGIVDKWSENAQDAGEAENSGIQTLREIISQLNQIANHILDG